MMTTVDHDVMARRQAGGGGAGGVRVGIASVRNMPDMDTAHTEYPQVSASSRNSAWPQVCRYYRSGWLPG